VASGRDRDVGLILVSSRATLQQRDDGGTQLKPSC
jgi:hypothetical protein